MKNGVRILSAPAIAAGSEAQQAPVPAEAEPHYHVLLKNESVIVTRLTLPACETTSSHSHARDCVTVNLTCGAICAQKQNETEGAAEAVLNSAGRESAWKS